MKYGYFCIYFLLHQVLKIWRFPFWLVFNVKYRVYPMRNHILFIEIHFSITFPSILDIDLNDKIYPTFLKHGHKIST